MTDEVATALRRQLRLARAALRWKLDGLGERELRMPRTPTGTNLIGIVKHMANVEIGYFGDTFDRSWPTPDERVSEAVLQEDPQADWYATPDESSAGILDLYQRVEAFAEETFDSRPLDALGEVPWWPPEHSTVTLGQVAVHVLVDLARHVGHADILREQIDGSVGLREAVSNLPERDWPVYVAQLRELAERHEPGGRLD